MSILGVSIEDSKHDCSYFCDRQATFENYIIYDVSAKDFEVLLEGGFRHFGAYFFRPICPSCRRCIPIRVVLDNYSFPKQAKRLFKRNANLKVTLHKPRPSIQSFELYLKHKKRFEKDDNITYEQFIELFFSDFEFSQQLSIYDSGKLIAVSHLDITDRLLSAVYCYYDDSYYNESLGTFAVYSEIAIGLKRNITRLYLGYYLQENCHMNYKSRFRPNQLLLGDHKWVDFISTENSINSAINIESGFLPNRGDILRSVEV